MIASVHTSRRGIWFVAPEITMQAQFLAVEKWSNENRGRRNENHWSEYQPSGLTLQSNPAPNRGFLFQHKELILNWWSE